MATPIKTRNKKANIISAQKQPQINSFAWVFEKDNVESWAYWDNVFTAEECKEIIKLGENEILAPAKVSSSSQGKINNSIRESELAWLFANENTNWIFERVAGVVEDLNNRFFNFNLYGFFQGFQFTKYEAPSGFYGMHIDKAYGHGVRKLSLTIQLSDPNEYEGGELLLQFGSKPDVMDKQQGKLILFPSYVLHEVRPVTKGARYSLVAWVAGPPFK